MALEPAGDFDAAEELLRQARDRLVALQGAHSPASLRARGNHVGVLVMMGRHEQAAPLLESLIEDHRRTLGLSHPAVGTLLGNLAISQAALGQTDASLGSLQSALEIAIANHGERHSEIGRLRINYAVALNDARRYEEAEAQARQADSILAERLGATHPWRLPTHSLAATAMAGTGRFADALAHMDALTALGVDASQLPPIIQLEWHVQWRDMPTNCRWLIAVPLQPAPRSACCRPSATTRRRRPSANGCGPCKLARPELPGRSRICDCERSPPVVGTQFRDQGCRPALMPHPVGIRNYMNQ